jgi:mycothiol synthase
MTRWSVTSGGLTPAQVTGVLALAEAAEAADGVMPLSEHVLLHLRYDVASPGRDTPGPDRDLILTADHEIAGYAHLDSTAPGTELSGEVVIRPDHRRQGLGLALVRALTAEAGGHPIRLWAHGDLPAAARLARAAGFARFRALWQMRRSLRDPLDPPRWPAGSTLRTFRPGRDEEEWLSLNRRAFAGHPEQGAWTRHDLELREREPWFDPAGFFIAERNGTMTGFHWTKVQEGVGEVYVVGVDPGEQGSGLGRALTLAGLHYLRDRGLDEAMLYVDEDNVPAIRMYQALGFTRWRTDAMYRTGLADGLAAVDPQRLIEFRGSQRPVGGCHRGQHLGVELYLIEGDPVVDTKVQLPGNRAHLRRRSRLCSLASQVTCRHCSSA